MMDGWDKTIAASRAIQEAADALYDDGLVAEASIVRKYGFSLENVIPVQRRAEALTAHVENKPARKALKDEK